MKLIILTLSLTSLLGFRQSNYISRVLDIKGTQIAIAEYIRGGK